MYKYSIIIKRATNKAAIMTNQIRLKIVHKEKLNEKYDIKRILTDDFINKFLTNFHYHSPFWYRWFFSNLGTQIKFGNFLMKIEINFNVDYDQHIFFQKELFEIIWNTIEAKTKMIKTTKIMTIVFKMHDVHEQQLQKIRKIQK